MTALARFAAVLACVWVAAPGDAQQRMLTDAEAGIYAAVGRLNVAGRSHCTATLVSETRVLTAAHCLFHPLTERMVRPEHLRFVAGLRRDAYAGLRGVTRIAVHPAYVHDRGGGLAAASADLALLELDAPVTPAEAPAIPVGRWTFDSDPHVVAYGRDRSFAASIRTGCAPGDLRENLVLIACDVTYGVSGAPVLQADADGPRVVGVVTVMRAAAAAGSGGGGAIVVAPRMAVLEAALAAP